MRRIADARRHVTKRSDDPSAEIFYCLRLERGGVLTSSGFAHRGRSKPQFPLPTFHFTNLSPILLVSRPGNLPAERCEVRRVGLPIWIRSNRKSGSPARSHALPMAGRGQADFDAGIGPIAEPADLRGDHIDAALKLLVLWSYLARCGRVWKLSARSGWRYRDVRFARYGGEQMAPRHLGLVRDGVDPVFKGLLVATPDSCDWLSDKFPDSLHEKAQRPGSLETLVPPTRL
jgi:hypothetical protein